ncbi:MAG: response regulator [Phycisphaerales bacterium]
MLMIERRPGTSILIGDDVRIHVREIKRRNSVRIGIEAPRFLPVVRSELQRDEVKSLAKTGRREFRVWVVEDNDAHAGIITTTLKARGVNEIERFPDARSIIAVLEGEEPWVAPDLVLLDLRLPDLPGLDVLNHLRLSDALRQTPVVVLSSSGEDEFIAQSLERGANAYVEKSCEYADFKESIIKITEFWSQARRVA